MSWEPYVQKILEYGGSTGMVCGHDGTVWAKSDSLEINTATMEKEIQALQEIGLFIPDPIVYQAWQPNKETKKPEPKTSISTYTYNATKNSLKSTGLKIELQDPFAILPSDICLEIASHMDADTIKSSIVVSKKWRQIFSDNRFWWLRFCNKFGPIEAHFEKVSPNYWKKIYRMHATSIIYYNRWYNFCRPQVCPLPKKTRFNIFGQRYFLIHRNEFFFGMKEERMGVIVFKTKMAYLIGLVDMSKQSIGNAAKHIGFVADYLKESGY